MVRQLSYYIEMSAKTYNHVYIFSKLANKKGSY